MITQATAPPAEHAVSGVAGRERVRRTTVRGSHSTVGKAVIYVLLVVGGLWFISPLLWMITTSLKPLHNVFSLSLVLVPSDIQWRNYTELFKVFQFWLYLRNTLIITVPSVAGQLVSSSLVAYGFSRVRWPGRNKVFIIVLATLMLPFQVTMIPLYIMFRHLGWINTFLPLIVPNFFGSAFDIFLLRQFFLRIPRELTEAALIDGAGHFMIYWRMILPLAKPALVTVGLFEFLYNWNDFLGPLIYLQGNHLYTLSLALQNFTTRNSAEPNLEMVASTLMVIPVTAVFLLTQRAFVRGISMGGVR